MQPEARMEENTDTWETIMACPYCGKKIIVSLFGSPTKQLYKHLAECEKRGKLDAT